VHLTSSELHELDEQIQPLVDALTVLDQGLSVEDRAAIEPFLRRAIAAFDHMSGADGRVAAAD